MPPTPMMRSNFHLPRRTAPTRVAARSVTMSLSEVMVEGEERICGLIGWTHDKRGWFEVPYGLFLRSIVSPRSESFENECADLRHGPPNARHIHPPSPTWADT